MPTYDEFMQLAEERDRYRQHSIMLNQLGYTLGVALGEAELGRDFQGDPELLAARLIDQRDQLRRRIDGARLACEDAQRTGVSGGILARVVLAYLAEPAAGGRVRLDLGHGV